MRLLWTCTRSARSLDTSLSYLLCLALGRACSALALLALALRRRSRLYSLSLSCYGLRLVSFEYFLHPCSKNFSLDLRLLCACARSVLAQDFSLSLSLVMPSAWSRSSIFCTLARKNFSLDFRLHCACASSSRSVETFVSLDMPCAWSLVAALLAS